MEGREHHVVEPHDGVSCQLINLVPTLRWRQGRGALSTPSVREHFDKFSGGRLHGSS
jgi:hypothetical protein